MASTINYSIAADFEDGPNISKSAAITATAYDLVDVVVPKSGSETVDVQPGDTGDVSLFFMYSDNYTLLTYTVDGGGSKTLDGPLILIGTGPVKLLGATCKIFVFTNAGAVRDANVKIFTARVAED